MKCCHSEFYQQQTIFKMLPGHEAVLLALPKYIDEYLAKKRSETFACKGKYSYILGEMIQTAESNLFKDDLPAQYPDSVRFFFTYIFIVCGRFCYEMLRANLPIPSTKTIRKLFFLISRPKYHNILITNS